MWLPHPYLQPKSLNHVIQLALHVATTLLPATKVCKLRQTVRITYSYHTPTCNRSLQTTSYSSHYLWLPHFYLQPKYVSHVIQIEIPAATSLSPAAEVCKPRHTDRITCGYHTLTCSQSVRLHTSYSVDYLRLPHYHLQPVC